jgi:CRP/FNR family transcriptional regulator
MKITTEEELQKLRNVPLFRKLKPSELKIVALSMETFIFGAGEVIVQEGDEGDEAYIIYSGQVKVYRALNQERSVILNELGPGEMFGEMALFGDGWRTASVQAVRETLVGVISKERLYEIIREFPDIALGMLKIQTQRFSRAENLLLDFIKKGEQKA